MNKQELNGIIFTSLQNSGISVLPYCIKSHAYSTLYLPEFKTIIPIDLKDDKGRRSPDNPVVQNNAAKEDGLLVFRIRSMSCTPFSMDSFDYYLDDFSESTLLQLINYLITDYKGTPLSSLPPLQQSLNVFSEAISSYDDYFTRLCIEYSSLTSHFSIRNKEEFKDENIGVWLAFKGIDFKIEHGDMVIRSRLSSISDSQSIARQEALKSANSKVDEQWLDTYNSFKQYCDSIGGINNVKRDDKTFGGWLTRQRTAFRNNTLSEERTRLLNELGIIWSPNEHIANKWDEMLELLIQYNSEYGTMDPPQSTNYHGKNLGRWVAKQRQLYRKGMLLKERQTKLEDIGFLWSSYRYS